MYIKHPLCINLDTINLDTKTNIKTSDVTKSYIRDNYIESEMEENINMRNQYYIKNFSISC